MHGNVDGIGSVPQDKGSFIVSKDLESVSEEERVELVEENFKATREIEDGHKWDGIYEANAYTA